MAIAVALGIGGDTEIWVLDDDPSLNWVRVTTTVTTTEPPTATVVHVHAAERACVTIPIHVEDDGDIYLGPELERTFTGGLTMSDIRVSMVGHFLNIAFGYIVAVDPEDMVLSSIDATGLAEVTICE